MMENQHQESSVTHRLTTLGILTIEAILERAARLSQLCSVDFVSRQNSVEDEADQIVDEDPAGSFPAHETSNPILRPWNLVLEVVPRE